MPDQQSERERERPRNRERDAAREPARETEPRPGQGGSQHAGQQSYFERAVARAKHRQSLGGGSQTELERESRSSPRFHLDVTGRQNQGAIESGFGIEGYRDYEGLKKRTRWHRETLTAREIMTTNVKTATRQTPIREIAEIMKEENVGVVPVVDDGRRLVGIVTDRDIVVRAVAENINGPTAEDVMTDDVEAVRVDETLREVVEIMGRRQIRRTPVVDSNDRLIGIISMADVATRADVDEDLQEALEKISARRSFWSRIWS